MDKQNPSVKDWSFFIGSPDEEIVRHNISNTELQSNN